MAIICLACFPKRSADLKFLRLLRKAYCTQKLVQSSVAKYPANTRDAPVKFTTNKASAIPISETLGLTRKKETSKKVTTQIIFISLGVFLLYFCCLREENDIDEILKGNNVANNDKVKLVNLKLQLNYCTKNNLPTEALKAKIRELEEKEVLSSPFRK